MVRSSSAPGLIQTLVFPRRSTIPRRAGVPGTGAVMNRSATEISGAAATAPDLDGTDRVFDLSVAGRCIPAGRAGEPIAGDYYDAYALDDDRVLIALGDVAGHGRGAGPRMRRLRAAARHLAQRTSSPAELLTLLDEVHGCGSDDDIATVWIGIYDNDTSILRYASAGHPPPVIVEVGAPAGLLAEASAPPLGTGAVAAHVQVDEVFWPAGALLVAYSDGLIERPERDLEDQLHHLRELVGRANAAPFVEATPRSVAEALVCALLPGRECALDDVCILVLRREATPRTTSRPFAPPVTESAASPRAHAAAGTYA
jgi:serine phosphatase RsbU (regulator of sigma subunit)